MQKILIIIFITIMLFPVCGCNNGTNTTNEIPEKKADNDNSSLHSPVNSFNLDEYMDRDDVQYVDVRSSTMILEEGYVEGFEFIPFYSIIASFSSNSALYKMTNIYDEDGNFIGAGQVGSFIPQYEESEMIVKSLFSRSKYLFIISQAGSESMYLINLLIQLGYNSTLLYNVGGVSNGEGIASYRDVEGNKHYVAGHSGFMPTVSYGFTASLTPIN